MADRLVTIATFDQPPKARLAQNALKEAGIRAVVSDESTVNMDWLLGNAIGWVKLQVLEPDAERAVAALEQAFGESGEGMDAPTPEELAAEAEAAVPEADDEPTGAVARTPAPPPGAVAGAPEELPEEVLSEREQYARRTFYAGLFGLLMPIILFYGLYLLQVAAFGEGRLGPRGRRWLWAGAAMIGFGMIGWWVWVLFIPRDFFDIL